MTDTSKYLTRMALFLVVVAAGCAFIADKLLLIFLVNPLLNGFIFAVIVIGAVMNFRQVILLAPEARWMENLRVTAAQSESSLSDLRAEGEQPQLRLLASMARMLGEKRGRLMLSPQAMRTLLDGIAARLEESNDLARYFTGLCIFLGLLGTFWGLLETVKSIADVIRNLSVTGDDMAAIFGNLKKGLEAPLAGMGTAFSSSLFGLAGSLVLGFLDLQASQAQNAFFNELEEWLSGITNVSSGTSEGGGQGVSVYTEALLEQTAERLQDMVTLLNRSEQNRSHSNQQLDDLNSKLAILADQMRAEQQVLLKLAENQRELTPVIRGLGETLTRLGGLDMGSGGFDDATRGHIRSIDTSLSRLAASLESGRDETVREIRGEIKLLARTVAAVGGRDGDSAAG